MKIPSYALRQESDFSGLPDNVFQICKPADDQIEQLSDAAQRQLTFSENLQAEPRTVSLSHEVPVTIDLQVLAVKPQHAWISAVSDFEYVPDLAWQAVDVNRVQVKVRWPSDPGAPRDVTIVFQGA